MNDTELEELQDPEEWADAEDAVGEPSKPRRAVVSVSFPREDFERVAAHAQEQGMKLSEYIRQAAISRATARHAHETSVSVSGPVRTGHSGPRNRASRATTRIRDDDGSYTT